MYYLYLNYTFVLSILNDSRDRKPIKSKAKHSDIPVHIKIRYNIKRKIETSIDKIPFGFTTTKKDQKRIRQFYDDRSFEYTKITLKLSENENFPLATAYIV